MWSLASRLSLIGMIFRRGCLSPVWSFVGCGLSSVWCFVGVVSLLYGLLSGLSLIGVVFRRGGLSSVWSFVGVVSHRCGLSSGLSHRCGLLSGWSLVTAGSTVLTGTGDTQNWSAWT